MDVLQKALAIKLFSLLLEKNFILVSTLGLQIILTQLSAAVTTGHYDEARPGGCLLLHNCFLLVQRCPRGEEIIRLGLLDVAIQVVAGSASEGQRRRLLHPHRVPMVEVEGAPTRVSRPLLLLVSRSFATNPGADDGGVFCVS